MSAFWKYFADTLRWPQIHMPGALQAFTRGLAGHFDASRDDALYLREQFFPAKAEPAILPSHGDSRGITRHPSETDAQFRTRVVHAWRWHDLGGKTLGLPEILAFYGYSVARIENSGLSLASKWAEFQIELREPVTSDEQALQLTGLTTLIWLTNEYKPARSVLSRIYHSGYDVRPLILDRRFGLDGNYLDGESGIYDPETGVVVSFGNRIRSQAEAIDRTPFLSWTEGCACLVDYMKSYQLDRFRLDVPLLQPVMLSTSPIECAEIEATDHSHDLSCRVGRWVSKSQLVPDWSRLDGVNSRLDRPHIVRVGNPVRLDRYRLDASIDRRVIPIHELVHELILHMASPRPVTVPQEISTALFCGEVYFELHNPRHRGQRYDNMFLDSPRKERFDLSETHTFGDAASEPDRPHHMAMPRTVARSQFALGSCRLDDGSRLDGDHAVNVLNPWRLDRYKLDASIGRTTKPVAGLGVVRASLGAVNRADESTPLWLGTACVFAAVPAEYRNVITSSKETACAVPKNLPRFPRVDALQMDGGSLDVHWLHGNPFAASVSLGGAENAPMFVEREAIEPTGIAVSEVSSVGDPARVPPALWASGWTARPWVPHFGYLQALPPLARLPAETRLDTSTLDRSLCHLNNEDTP